MRLRYRTREYPSLPLIRSRVVSPKDSLLIRIVSGYSMRFPTGRFRRYRSFDKYTHAGSHRITFYASVSLGSPYYRKLKNIPARILERKKIVTWGNFTRERLVDVRVRVYRDSVPIVKGG